MKSAVRSGAGAPLRIRVLGYAHAWTVAVLLGGIAQAQDAIEVDADGTVNIPAMRVPYSAMASEAAKRNFLETTEWLQDMQDAAAALRGTSEDQTIAMRRWLDENVFAPGVARLRAVFDVKIEPQSIAGVPTDVVTPAEGISRKNRDRVLINLHGGGFSVGAGLGGQMEAIPIAAIGRIKVITVDYRQWPEHRFPAASEDVAKVYAELLKQYRSENIGIYGCSAGGILTAQAVAWFQKHDLPRPGAVGMFGAGAIRAEGDSAYVGPVLTGYPPRGKTAIGYLDVPGLDVSAALVSPAFHQRVLAQFPPSLLISGTRDVGMSSVIYTHAQLVKAGADASLHMWEGMPHCSFAQPIVDPDVPETRETWDVTVKFFDRYLGGS